MYVTLVPQVTYVKLGISRIGAIRQENRRTPSGKSDDSHRVRYFRRGTALGGRHERGRGRGWMECGLAIISPSSLAERRCRARADRARGLPRSPRAPCLRRCRTSSYAAPHHFISTIRVCIAWTAKQGVTFFFYACL